MTLGEGKEKVYMLLDEHSAGGEVEHDDDIELKMTRFFDMAQKLLSQIAPAVKTYAVHRQAGRTEYVMPEDFRRVIRLWRNGWPVTGRYAWQAGRLLIPERDEGDFLVEYASIPETIGADAPDDYEFELGEDACECMPYYVAAQQLLPDLVLDYGAMLRMYQLSVERLEAARQGGAVLRRQSFFRGGKENP